MIHAVLDTNIFRQDPQRKSAAFQAVSKMGNAGGLTVHIPYFVKHEVLSRRREEYEDVLGNAVAGLKKLSKMLAALEMAEQFEEQLTGLDRLSKPPVEWINDEFEFWCGHVGAEQHDIKNHHGENMAKRYFSGSLPFRDAKNRKDIPDAFIYLSVADIADGVDELNVISADQRFREACNAITNVVTYEKLDDFIKSPGCAEVLIEVEIVDHFDSLINKLDENLEEISRTASEKLFNELIDLPFSDPCIPDDNHEATLSMLDVPADIGIDLEEAEYYGGGIIAVPFSFQTDVLGSYYIFKADFGALTEGRAASIGISEYGNKHYYEAEEEFSVTVNGRITLTMDLSSLPNGEVSLDHLGAVTAEAGVEVSEISDITVNDPGSYQ